MKNTDWNVFVYSHADNFVTTILINYAKILLVLLVVIIGVFSIVSYFICIPNLQFL